nr:MAG TPA: hypothetical protein [Caudoviricetes sp.]
MLTLLDPDPLKPLRNVPDSLEPCLKRFPMGYLLR